MGLAAYPASKQKIWDYVNNIRKSVNMYSKVNFPVLHFIENILPEMDSSFSFLYVDPDELPISTYADYNPLYNEMRISTDVYNNAYQGQGRARFTLAHEIGHYFLHSDAASFQRVDPHILIPTFRDPEWQANVFASALLMPNHIICGMSVDEVVEKCGASYHAAMIALDNAKKSSL